MSDSAEIDSLISKDDSMDDFPAFTDKQLVYVEDSNNGSYTSGTVKFELSSMKGQWVTWNESYILMPISVSGVGTALTATSLLACKQSVLSFINGVFFSANNNLILNETDINIVNNLKLLTNFDYEFMKEYGAELHFSKDTATQVTNAAANTGIVNDVTANAGFKDRVQFFKQSSSFSAGAFTTVVKIPLKFLHDLFRGMDFPLINFEYKLNLSLNMYQNQSFAPMTKDISASLTTGLTTTIGTANIPGSMVTLNKVRLYYHTVKFDGKLANRLASKLSSGFSKKVWYTITDTYSPLASEIGTTNGNVSRTLTSSCAHPLRVWALGVPTLSLSGSGSTALDTGLCTPVAAFNNVNVKIANRPYYDLALDNPVEIWDVLQQQFPLSGSVSIKRGGCINYSEFLSGQRYTCIDVSRQSGRQENPNAPIEISISANRDSSNTAALDYYYIVERLGCVSFHINDQRASVLVSLDQ